VSRATAPAIVADICLYGTHDSRVGAGYYGLIADGRRFGTGDPEPGRIFTEAIFLACGELRARGIDRGLVRIFDTGGMRMATIDVGRWIPCYGDMRWEQAPAYVLNAETLVAAAEPVEVRS
jgi:hypothetical protein